MQKNRINRLLATTLLAGASCVARGEYAYSQDSAADGDAVLLETIIVTARRRQELIQETPVSVTVLPGDDVTAGEITDLEDAAFRSPNTVYNGQGGPLTIRGIGSLGISGGVDRSPAVGLFLDDVFLARPAGFPVLLEDLERVEVVRGSQSLLYGKNTIGGAVNLISRNPDGTLGAELSATYGSNSERRVEAALQSPIKGTGLAFRTIAAWAADDGYITNLATGKDVSDLNQLLGRFVLSGDLNETTRLKATADFSRDTDDGGLWYAPLDQAYRHKASHDFLPENEISAGGVSLRLDHSFEAAELTSITALRGHDMSTYLDGDFTSAAFIGQGQKEYQRQFSQEFRLGSLTDGPFRWSGGLFYMHEYFEGTQYFDYAFVPRDLWSRDEFQQSADTYSAFAEAGYTVLSNLELSAGARVSHDRKRTTSEISSPSGTYLFGTPGYAEGDVSFTNVSPEVSATWHFSEGNIAYGKISRGYKAGGISPYIEADGSANTYDPELTTTYEIGVKTTLLDGRLTLAVDAFYVDWKDQQAVIYTTPFTRVYRNAAAATSRGLELEGEWIVTDGLSLTAGYGYTDAVYEDFVDDIAGENYSGNPLPFAPEHSFNLGARWAREFGSGWLVSAGADYSFRSSYSFTPNNAYRQGETHLVDAHLGVRKGNWSARLWGKNLTDETYLQNYFDYAGTDMGVAAPGRTFGLTVAAKW